MKPRPWYETFPKEHWTGEDLALAIQDGYKVTPSVPPDHKALEQRPIVQPTHLAPAWNPLRPMRKKSDSAQGRAVDQLLHDLGIR